MEYGTVEYVGKNPSGNQYGFVVTDSGEELYFHEATGRYVLIYDESGPHFPTSWSELIPAKDRMVTSPFPALGDRLAFARNPHLFGRRANMSMWCPESLVTASPTLAPDAGGFLPNGWIDPYPHNDLEHPCYQACCEPDAYPQPYVWSCQGQDCPAHLRRPGKCPACAA